MSKRVAVDHVFGLDEEGVEGLILQVPLEEDLSQGGLDRPDEAFPTSAKVWC